MDKLKFVEKRISLVSFIVNNVKQALSSYTLPRPGEAQQNKKKGGGGLLFLYSINRKPHPDSNKRNIPTLRYSQS